MADQRVVITLNVNSRGSAQITAMQKQLAALDRQENKLSRTTKMADEYFLKLAHKTDMVSKSFQKMRTIIGTMVGIFSKFNAVLSVVATVTLPLLNAAFAAGRLVVKAYHAALQLVAVGVAAVGSAVAIGLAAFKEYNAAMQSYAYSATSSVSQTQRASGAIRNLQRDAKLAVFGITGLNDAFVQVNQSSTFTGESQKMLRALSDFAAAGGDPAKNIAAAGAFIGLLQKEGKLTQEVLQAGQKIGPQFAKALEVAKRKGMSSAADLTRMLYSGELAMMGGVAGQADRLNQTLFAQLKRTFSEMMVIGSDLGDAMLGPAKKALGEISASLLRTMRRISPAFASFGKGTFLDGLVSGFIKLEDAMVRLFRKYLPESVGMLRNFVSWWDKVVFVFKNLRERMEPLLEAGRAVMDIFGPAFTQIFSRFGDKYGEIGVLIADNREEFDRLGVNLERFVNLFFDFGTTLETAFAKALPIINSLAEAFMTIAEAVLSIVRGLAGFGGSSGIGGMAALYAMFAGKRMIIGKKGADGRRQRGVKAVPGVAFAQNKLSGFNSLLGPLGVLPGGFGLGSRRGGGLPGLRPVNTMTPLMGQLYTAEALATLENQHAGDVLKKIRLIDKYRAFREGPGAGLEGMNRSGAAARALGQWQKQLPARLKKLPGRAGRAMLSTKGYAPTGLGAGIASTLISQALMGQMGFADTGLGGAGQTVASMGSMVGMFNPLAGLGLTLAGGALGAKTAGGGALTGAGAGAAFGTMVGGPVGAAVGAMLGAVVGGIAGAINKYKGEKKTLQAAAQKRGGEILNLVVKSFAEAGDFSKTKSLTDKLRKEADDIRALGLEGMDRDVRKMKLQELKASGKITSEQMDLLQNGVTAYVDGLDKQAKNIDVVSGVIENNFNRNMDVMRSITGKTQEEILNLANEMGVNLYDATLETTDALQKMGLAMKYTAEQVSGAIIDIQQNALDPLRQKVAKLDADRQIETLVQSMADMGSAAEDQDVLTFGADLVDLLNIKFPESPSQNIKRAIDTIKMAILPGGPLAGMADLMQSVLLPELGIAQVAQAKALPGELAGIISRGFAAEGKLLPADQLAAQIKNMTPEQLAKLEADVRSGAIFEQLGPLQRRRPGEADIGEYFKDIDFKYIISGSAEAALALLTDEQRAMVDGIGAALTGALDDSPGWWTNPPKWWSTTPDDLDGQNGGTWPPPDTSTPKIKQIGDTATSKLAQTLAKHRMIDTGVPGKRKMTSSLRNFNLGSINSDHVTGNAYDLTGQNLGEYAWTVKRGGGLAEFHGWGSSRHLHVVPGMNPMGQWFEDYKWGQELAGRTGDTPTPAVPRVALNSSSVGSTSNYSVVVNGANADPNQIADAVINKIQRMERDKKERR